MTSCPAAPSPSSASSWDQDGTATTSSAGASTPTRVSASSGEPEPSLGWARAASRRRRTDARPRWSGARARRERTSRVVRDADAYTIGATPLDFAFGLGASAVVVVFPKRRTCRWRALGALAATRNSRPTPATRARTDMSLRGVFEAGRAWSPRASMCATSPRATRSSVSSSEARAQVSCFSFRGPMDISNVLRRFGSSRHHLPPLAPPFSPMRFLKKFTPCSANTTSSWCTARLVFRCRSSRPGPTLSSV